MTKHVDGENICSRLERLITDYEQSRDPDSTEIGQQFATLQRTMIEAKEKCPSIEGAKPHNRLKNRYKDVLPYDTSRVILESDSSKSDYINASYVKDFNGNNRYIAAQGPIDESAADFLRMIWELQITSVICAANETEAGRFKFRRYWPIDEKYVQFGAYRVSRDETKERAFSCECYQVHPLIITQGDNRRQFLLYHFSHWHDHDVPNEEGPVLELLLRLYDDRNLSPNTPILVHCSAGCGRTGSIIAIDLCRLLIDNERLPSGKLQHSHSIYEIAAHIRQFRIAMIQTIKQYLFVHKMFVYMMKSKSITSLYSPLTNDENQSLHSSLPTKPSVPHRPPRLSPSILREPPPLGRHSNNGADNSNSSSPRRSPSFLMEKPQGSNQPPPIPPRSSLIPATNKYAEGQFVPAGEIPIKAKRTIFRSRNVGRREPATTTTTTTVPLKGVRADSVDALSGSSSRHHRRRRRRGNPVEQETNSD